MSYLSARKRKENINFYAMESFWDREEKKRKKKQVFLGSCLKGRCVFNKSALDFANLFRGTQWEREYWNWRELSQINETNDIVVAQQDILDADDRRAGVSLVLDSVERELGLRDCLQAVFNSSTVNKILSLAYFCATGSRRSLNYASVWTKDHYLPGDETEGISEAGINRLLALIDASQILQFQTLWLKKFPKEQRLSLDITSVSTYSKNITDAMRGYNRDRENLEQINLLLLVGQTNKLPLWFEQLPGAISDITTIKDTVKLLTDIDNTSKDIVFDRGFASAENIACLQKNGIKFTMGIPLERFSWVVGEIQKAVKQYAFSRPEGSMQMFDEASVMQSSAITINKKINGHRAYLHLYNCNYYRVESENRLAAQIQEVYELLCHEKPLKTDGQKAIAEQCFIVKKTPVRGLSVKSIPENIEKFKNSLSGYFAILSNSLKDPYDAMYVYKLRDGIEKRFDDLKNEEDMRRLRVHSAHNMQARLFIQFIAEILRCGVLKKLQDLAQSERREQFKKLRNMTVTELLSEVDSLRRIRIANHQAFYKRPTLTQREILTIFGVNMTGAKWPGLNKIL
mgnify:CR=1 FL=1